MLLSKFLLTAYNKFSVQIFLLYILKQIRIIVENSNFSCDYQLNIFYFFLLIIHQTLACFHLFYLEIFCKIFFIFISQIMHRLLIYEAEILK
jgi:uncharacterized membrane protein YozB (DUF420 family)